MDIDLFVPSFQRVRASSETFERYPDGFKKLVFWMPDRVRHDREFWTINMNLWLKPRGY
jgi:hypothetical protein